MKKLFLTFSFLFVVINVIFCQSIVQTIRGTVIELNTEIPVIGASVALTDFKPVIGTTTNDEGSFRITNVPVGRHLVQVSFIGYKTVTIPVELMSGKEI